jgi:hypothetical protein
MSESKHTHTPGPWIKDGKVITNESYKQIALVAIHEKSIEEREANLTLIAAAPEMLEALGNILKLAYDLRGDDFNISCQIKEICEPIINKAKGQ